MENLQHGVEVCSACGSDYGCCCTPPKVTVVACQFMHDDGRQCARPLDVHTSGWSHCFVPDAKGWYGTIPGGE